jgi:serine/threonine protein kinase
MSNVYFAFEFLGGGELLSRLRRLKRFSNDIAKFYAAEILLALEAMHVRCAPVGACVFVPANCARAPVRLP